ncbi:MAG TPA: hypothetical protein VM093_06140 [Aeromicrobium sp.]|nr:hypothetical protein [Aeromicrobium sp.]
MRLAPREALVLAMSGVIAGAGAWAAWTGAMKGALIALTLLALLSIALQLWVLRRVALRQQSLDRLERKLDVVARRVVTESEALSAEIRRRDM